MVVYQEIENLEIEINKLINKICYKHVSYPTLNLANFLNNQFNDIIEINKIIGGGLENV